MSSALQYTCNEIEFHGCKESAEDSPDDNIELQNRKNIEEFNAL